MFKGTEPTKYIRLAYLTGILSIKKIKTQSALNNFDEFTMLDAKIFAPYIGFTETEMGRFVSSIIEILMKSKGGTMVIYWGSIMYITQSGCQHHDVGRFSELLVKYGNI